MNVDTGQKTWITPRWIVDALGPFDLDPCCPDEGMPWPTARRMVRKSEDGLSVDWAEDRVWLNPPYGRESRPFLERMAKRGGGGGIALVFGRTDTRTWQQHIFPVADSLLFMAGRVRFCDAEGKQKESAPAPSVLVAYSPADTRRLQESGIEGALVRLKGN